MINLTSNRVMVRPCREALRSPGGLLLLDPETTFTHDPSWAKERADTRGEVLAIGPKVTEIAVGDRVRYSDSSGHLLTLNGEALRFIRDDDIAAVL